MRARLFEGLNLAETDNCGELRSIVHYGFGSRSAASQNAANYVVREFFEISFEFRISSFEVRSQRQM
jgi:hypothetical protein